MSKCFQYSTRVEQDDDDDEEDGKVLIRYDVHYDEENVAYAVVYPLSTEGDGPWISGLYVRPKHRNQGLASELMRRIESDFEGQVLRGRARPYKDASVSLETLLRLYKAWGFEPYDEEEPTRLKKQV